jgi:hypothetical protein
LAAGSLCPAACWWAGCALIACANSTSRRFQEILGHSTFRMTADIYGDLADDVRRERGNQMQRAMGG